MPSGSPAELREKGDKPYSWQNYLSAQVPMLWVPNAAYMVNEIKDNLKGVTPEQPTLNLVPEDWYYVK